MEPCVLLINDIHISKDCIPEFMVNWEEALCICRKRSIHTMVVGGDLFQSRSSQTLDVLLAVRDALCKAELSGVFVYLANGNHDKVNPESVRGYCHVFDQHKNVEVIDEWQTVLDSDRWEFALHVIPYFPENGSFKEKLSALMEEDLCFDRKNYLYIHEGVNGALAQASEDELPTHIFQDFDKVFAGHYHNRCQVKNSVVEFIGSSRQHNFGEDEEKGYTILYTNGESEFVKNEANTRYRMIEVPIEKVNTHLTDELEEIKAEGRYRVKVRVCSTIAKANGFDKSALLKAGASKVEVVTTDPAITETRSTSLFEKLDTNQIKESYEEFCQLKEIENIDLGLSYLSKIG